MPRTSDFADVLGPLGALGSLRCPRSQTQGTISASMGLKGENHHSRDRFGSFSRELAKDMAVRATLDSSRRGSGNSGL